MDQLLRDQNAQATSSGSEKLSEEQLKQVLGGVLSFVKAKFPNLDFSRVKTVLPDADQLMAQAEVNNASNKASKGNGGGGFFANAMSILEQVTQDNNDKDDVVITTTNPADGTTTTTGGATSAAVTVDPNAPRDAVDSLPELIACLAKAGVKPRTLRSLLPTVGAFLKQRAGVDVSSVLGGSGNNDNDDTGNTNASTTSSAPTSSTATTTGAGGDGFVAEFAQ